MNRSAKVAETLKLAGRLSVPRVTFHTGWSWKRSKANLIRPKIGHIFGTERSAGHHFVGGQVSRGEGGVRRGKRQRRQIVIDW